MFIAIVFLSYAFGCATTIALLVYLYMRRGLSQPGPIAEQNQYQTFQPLPEVSSSSFEMAVALMYVYLRIFGQKIPLLTLSIVSFNLSFKN